ncbi:uncharacterized protein LOC130014986 [Mercurialis annua]|uniref:uncharacterized protein LOC130014986 n=1 Tax=Mercurialis annua TaxID=3986 RepID=UPI0024AEC310|nr:uncharacterized protein LOC130014986 [Mercurialis annua]
MSKPSQRKILLLLQLKSLSKSSSSSFTSSLCSRRITTQGPSSYSIFSSLNPSFTSKSTSLYNTATKLNVGSNYSSFSLLSKQRGSSSPWYYGMNTHFSSSNLGGKTVNGFARKVVEKPAAAFSRYRGAIGLQMDAFWKRNVLFLVGAGGVVMCGLLWRIMFGIANTFVGLSEGMAKYGFLALSSAIVAFALSGFGGSKNSIKNFYKNLTKHFSEVF